MARKIIFAFVAIFCISFQTYAQTGPSISSVTGAFSDANTVTISGGGFGTHSLDIQWLGGANGNIEQGTDGGIVSLPSGWSVDKDSGGFSASRYSTTRYHSGSKSIRSPIKDSGGNKYGAGYYYDAGSMSKAYVTWWTFFDNHNNAGGQWKVYRIMCSDSGIYHDDYTISYVAQWWDQNGNDAGGFYTGDNPCGNEIGAYFDWHEFLKQETWVRFEYWHEEGSPGRYIIRVYRPNKVVDEVVNENRTIPSTARYLVWQNYWGNHDQHGGAQTSDADIYSDDHYVSIGTRARVEVCGESTWSNRKHCEIQIPTEWSSNSITFAVNKGSFAPCSTYYLYVVDANGNVNANGYPIELVTGTGAAPCPPKSLTIK